MSAIGRSPPAGHYYSSKLQKNQLATFSWKMSQIKQNNLGGFVG